MAEGQDLGLECPAPSDQVDDQYNHCDDQENVDQTSCNVEAEAQNPQDQQDYKDSPEHARSPFELQRCLALMPVRRLNGLDADN